MNVIDPSGRAASLWVDANGDLLTDAQGDAPLPVGARLVEPGALEVNDNGELVISSQ